MQKYQVLHERKLKCNNIKINTIFEKISNIFIDKWKDIAYIILRFEKVSNNIKINTGGR